MKITLDIELTDCIDNNPDIVGRCYYPHEGNKILIIKGLSKALLKDTICHEIGHVIDWYMSNGKQSENIDTREKIADEIEETLCNCIALKNL